MAKLKTRKAVKKRIRITKKGKVKVSKAFNGHLLTGKSRKRKRHLKRRSQIYSSEGKKLRAMMPYR